MRARAASLLFFATAACAACDLVVGLGGLTGGSRSGSPDAEGFDARFDTAADLMGESDAAAPTDSADDTVPDRASDVPVVGAPDSPADAPPACVMPISRVQPAHNDTLTTMSDSISVIMSMSQNAGDYMVVGCNYAPGCGPVQQINDTSGNTYAQVIAPDGASDAGTGLLETWAAGNIAAATAGTNTVTVTFTAICTDKNVKVVEYRGVDSTMPIDGTTFTHGGAGSAPTTTLTARANDVLFAHTADSQRAVGAGLGWALIFTDAWDTIAEDEFAASAGTYAATYQPIAGENWAIQAVALHCK